MLRSRVLGVSLGHKFQRGTPRASRREGISE
jgi:hypothetical protein